MTRRECSECGRFHAVPDIGGTGRTDCFKLPFLCWFRHKWEQRRECPYKDGHYEGLIKPGRPQRDQCARCGLLR